MNIFAYTELNVGNPAYVSLNKRNDIYILSVRSTGKQKVSEIEIPVSELIKLQSALLSIVSFEGDKYTF